MSFDNVKYIKVNAHVRHWKSADVNGIEDVDGALIPFREYDMWNILIDNKTGIIKNWPKNKTANVHYKICDAGNYYFIDENFNELYSLENDYVPRFLSPKENNFGDYIILDIDNNGKIEDWKVINELPEGFK
jgi:hypothetical protein